MLANPLTPHLPPFSADASAAERTIGFSALDKLSGGTIPLRMTLTSAPVSTNALSGKSLPSVLNKMDMNKVGGLNLEI